MKILHCVETYYPVKGGMQEVARQLSERLARMGHAVTVATRIHIDRKEKIVNGVQVIDFDLAGNSVVGISGDPVPYQEFLLKSDFDIITFFAAQQWATDLALPILRQLKAKKVFVPTGFPGLYWKEFTSYYEGMKTSIHDFDSIIFLSSDYKDINFARANGFTRFEIIANGADEQEFLVDYPVDVRKELNIPSSAGLVLHVGSYSGFKGQLEAMDIFLRAKIPGSVLMMIGNGYEDFKIPRRRPDLWARFLLNRWFGNNRIIINQFSREFTVAAYKAADVFLFPSNIECSPIVLFESAAAGLPFLTTDVGNAKEIVSWTGGGELMRTAIDKKGFSHVSVNDGVKMLRELLQNSEKRKQLSERGFKSWRDKFTWAQITKEYERLYSELLSKG